MKWWQQGNTRGFTLLELLIVIAIIGILTSIVLVNLQRARVSSHGGAILKQLQQVELALRMYISDKYPNTWPASYSNCQQIKYMVGGPSSYPFGVCRNGAHGPQHTLFSGFSSYLGGAPLDLQTTGFYLYQTPAGTDKDIDLVLCPDPYVTDPDNPGGGVLLRIGDNGDSSSTIPPIFNYLDKVIDNSDGVACGSVRMRNSTDPEIYWIMAEGRADVMF